MALTTIPASLSATALTLTTAAQPNITSVGTLTGLTVSGNIAGTLTTAAQTNITSVGTLTGLVVNGNASIQTGALTLSGANPALVISNSGDAKVNFVRSSNTISYALSSAASGGHGFYDNAASAYDLYMKAGKVGIGTTNPADALHILDTSGHAYASVARSTQSQGEVGLRLRGGTSGNDWYIYQKPSNNNLNFYNTSDRMTIDSSGNVGIGTTSPEGRLHVEVLGSNATPPIKINRGRDGGRIQLQYSSNETGYGEIGQMYAGTGRTQIWIGANLNSFSTGHNSAPLQHDANYASWFSDWDSYRDRFTIGRIASGTTSSLMVIDSSGDVLIGSTTNLNVLSGTPKLQIGSGTGHASLQFYSGTSSVNGIYFGDTSSANVDRYDGYIEYQHANRLISFRASGVNPLTIKSTGLLLPAGNFGYHTTQEHYTASTPATSYSSASNITYNSSTQYWPDQGEKQICVINARAYTNYIHIKTNLTANNIMFYFRTKGYFYAVGCEEQLIGGYTYTNNSVISKDNQTVAGNTHTGDTYRASDGSLVLKMHVNQTGYTEGKMLVFFHAHAPSTTSGLTVTNVTQKDDGTNAF